MSNFCILCILCTNTGDKDYMGVQILIPPGIE